jgi:hypothetical protein
MIYILRRQQDGRVFRGELVQVGGRRTFITMKGVLLAQAEEGELWPRGWTPCENLPHGRPADADGVTQVLLNVPNELMPALDRLCGGKGKRTSWFINVIRREAGL